MRYGCLYGPGTAISEQGWMVNDIRKRRVPVIGGGGGVWSFVHIDDAARFTRAAVERGVPGVYNIVDDDPAPVSQWLPALADAVGAKPPLKVPAWIARFVIGDAVVFMTDVRGASNAKAKRAFGVNLIWPTWRDGFKKRTRRSLAGIVARMLAGASSICASWPNRHEFWLGRRVSTAHNGPVKQRRAPPSSSHSNSPARSARFAYDQDHCPLWRLGLAGERRTHDRGGGWS